MPVIFAVDASAKAPSPLVRRLMAAEFQVLSLPDCRAALESLRCIRAELVIVDVAARPPAAAAPEGLLRLLSRDGGDGPRTPVMVVGATPEYCRVLSELLVDGEIVPAAQSSPQEVVRRVGRYVAPPRRPPRQRPAGPSPAAATRQPEPSATLAR